MTVQAYEQLIQEGIRGLPPDALAEIADFVCFIRKRVLQPQAFDEERYALGLGVDRKALSRAEEAHLLKEFEGYDEQYPRE
jgi:hypothetical protein